MTRVLFPNLVLYVHWVEFVQDGGVFERGPKICSFSTLTFMFSRSILMFLSFLYLFIVMSNLTVEKLEEILEEKLRKVIQPLSKQIEDAMQSVNALNTKYDQIVKTLKDIDKAKDKKMVENASFSRNLSTIWSNTREEIAWKFEVYLCPPHRRIWTKLMKEFILTQILTGKVILTILQKKLNVV